MFLSEPMEAPRARLGRLLVVLDRGFPLLGFLVVLFLPSATFAAASFAGWHDQALYLEALRSVLESGRADLIEDDIIGPAYIAIAAGMHWALGLTPESSLVMLSKVSYAGSVGVSLVMVRVLVGRIAASPPAVTIATQAALLALVFGSWTWRWAEFPWTHFVAALAGLSFYALRFSTTKASPLTSALIGVALTGLALMRTFEFVALVLAWALGLAVMTCLGALRPRRIGRANALAGIAAALLTVVLVYGVTGKRDPFILYGSNLGHLSAAVDVEEIAETPTFSIGLLPTKVVQLFVDPCFLSICRLDDYGPRPSDVLEMWRMPLAIQLPGLLLLPLCVVGVAFLAGWSRRGKHLGQSNVRELRQLVEMTIAASGLALGYTSTTLTGPGHLKFGFFREYLLASMLVGVVSVCLLFVVLWSIFRKRRHFALPFGRRLSPEAVVVACVIAGIIALLVGISTMRSHGLPRIESRHLSAVQYSASCRGDRCRISMIAKNPRGSRVAIPGASTLTFGCGSKRARFSVYVRRLMDGVRLPPSCRDPRLTAAWPLVMGLPADSNHLRAVDVTSSR